MNTNKNVSAGEIRLKLFMGRPTKYKEEYVEQAEKLCKLGATDAELADFFEVDEDTINEWKKVYPEFSESIKRGKTLADANVAERLFQRAMGFEHDSEEIKVMYDKETNDQYIERVPVRKIYPPDTTAAIFWLKNRQKGKWRDKNETELSGGLGVTWVENKNYGSDGKADTGN